MKKVILFILTIFLSSAVFAQTYNTIDIDGVAPGSKANDWNSDEDFTDVSSADNAYFTWDADYIYVGIKDADADLEQATFIYFDTDPGGDNGYIGGYAWGSGSDVTLPFKGDYAIVIKNDFGDDYIEIRTLSSGGYVQVAQETALTLDSSPYYVQAAIGTDYREFRIKRTTIGSPDAIKVCMFTEQLSGSNWRYFAWPSAGWTDANRTGSQTIAHYKGYTLSEGYSPDAANAHDDVLLKNSAYLSFDGANDYVKYNDDDTLGLMDGATDYTMEAWIYPIDGTVAEYDRVLQRYYSFAIVMYDGDNNGKVEDWYFQVYDAGSSSWQYYNTEGDSTLTLDEWNHIAVINNSSSGTLKLFVNGTDVTTTGGYTNRPTQASVASDNLYIGQKGNGASFFGGYIDEIRLKDAAVDPANLHSSITDNGYYSDGNTAILFHFDEGSGDSTTNAVSSVKGRLGDVADGDAAQPTWVTTVAGLPLPVELTSFTASSTSSATILNWETATEVNNYGFDVESKRASTDEWTTLGFVNGHGNSNTPQSYSFVATDGAKQYRLKQIDTDGSFEYSDVVEVEANLSYKLSQNHPNPFNPTTQINFSIPEAAKVSITVFNALGQEVVELANREFAVGNHTVNFNASNLTSGIYFYRMNSANFSKTMKMLLLK